MPLVCGGLRNMARSTATEEPTDWPKRRADRDKDPHKKKNLGFEYLLAKTQRSQDLTGNGKKKRVTCNRNSNRAKETPSQSDAK